MKVAALEAAVTRVSDQSSVASVFNKTPFERIWKWPKPTAPTKEYPFQAPSPTYSNSSGRCDISSYFGQQYSNCRACLVMCSAPSPHHACVLVAPVDMSCAPKAPCGALLQRLCFPPTAPYGCNHVTSSFAMRPHGAWAVAPSDAMQVLRGSAFIYGAPSWRHTGAVGDVISAGHMKWNKDHET